MTKIFVQDKSLSLFIYLFTYLLTYLFMNTGYSRRPVGGATQLLATQTMEDHAQNMSSGLNWEPVSWKHFNC